MFDTPFFADPRTLLLGALTGLVFGFLLEKGGVTRYATIVGQFRLRDFTMLKIMLTAVVVGGAGVYGMLQLGWIVGLHVKTALLLGNALGGVIFGVGMVVLGYCPGTGIAAIGSGARDAIPGVVGMLVGAGLYAEVHPWFQAHVLGVGDFGKATLASVTGVSPWVFLAGIAVVSIVFFTWLGRRGRPARRRPERGIEGEAQRSPA